MTGIRLTCVSFRIVFLLNRIINLMLQCLQVKVGLGNVYPQSSQTNHGVVVVHVLRVGRTVICRYVTTTPCQSSDASDIPLHLLHE
jgi:hypothetical protein